MAMPRMSGKLVVAVVLLVMGMLGTSQAGLTLGVSLVQDEGKDKPGEEKPGEEKPDKEKPDKDKPGKDDKRNEDAVTQTVGYTVQVACEVGADARSTTCSFTGVAPDGASDVSHVDMPEEAVCSEAIGGDYEYVDPDPNTRITGYKSRGSTGTLTLVLVGEVTTAGTTTYWFNTGDGVFPADGPGLSCKSAAQNVPSSPETSDKDNAAAATPDTTGSLEILVATCTDVPENTDEFDWHGACDADGGVHAFALSSVSESPGEPISTASDASGKAQFAELAPGWYHLEMTDLIWCHATSDRVDSEGNLQIEAGQRTTVWMFVCPAATETEVTNPQLQGRGARVLVLTPSTMSAGHGHVGKYH